MGEIGEHYRDLKAARKRARDQKQRSRSPNRGRGTPKEQQQQQQGHQKPSSTQPRRRCWDWAIVTGNTHWAKNRSFFKDYRRVGQYVSTGFTEMLVYGIGTVELKVQAGPWGGSPVRTLLLKNVLHIPDAICNGFSMTLHDGTVGDWASAWGPIGRDRQDEVVWCSRPYNGLCKLAIAGNPKGESYVKKKGEALYVSIHLDGDVLKDIIRG